MIYLYLFNIKHKQMPIATFCDISICINSPKILIYNIHSNRHVNSNSSIKISHLITVNYYRGKLLHSAR